MRFQGLDLLRAAAIVLVLGRHFELALEEFFWTHTDPVLKHWDLGGWLGVDLFFALSGFLISSLLISEWKRTGTIDAKRFIVRRALKIVPLLYFLLICTLVGESFVKPFKLVSRLVAVDLAFASNYMPGYWGHIWSLALEVHFYLLMTVLAILLLRKRATLAPFAWSLGLCAAAVLAGRICLPPVAVVPDQFFTLQYPTHRRIDSLLIGALIACAFSSKEIWAKVARIKPYWYLLAGLLALSPVFWLPIEWFQERPFGFTLLQAGTSSLVLWALLKAPSTNILAASAAALGRHSYCIYLFHYPLYSIWRKIHSHFHLHFFYLEIAAMMGLAIAVGTVVSVFWEAPLLRLREKLFPAAPGASNGLRPPAA